MHSHLALQGVNRRVYAFGIYHESLLRQQPGAHLVLQTQGRAYLYLTSGMQ